MGLHVALMSGIRSDASDAARVDFTARMQGGVGR
jgi:hypothetical protein